MKEKFKLPEQAIRLWFWLFAALCLIAAVLMPDHGQMVEGMLRLCTLPYQSANSYFDASGGGFAGTFLNAAVICAICAAIYSLPGSKPDGVSVLAFFLTAGFCFWGMSCAEGEPLHAGKCLPVFHRHCAPDDGPSRPLSGRGCAWRDVFRRGSDAGGLLCHWPRSAGRADAQPEGTQGV